MPQRCVGQPSPPIPPPRPASPSTADRAHVASHFFESPPARFFTHRPVRIALLLTPPLPSVRVPAWPPDCKMARPDPRLVVGAGVYSRAKMIKIFAECSRLFGS